MTDPFAPRSTPFAVALALDAALGEPPTALHPGGGLGRAVRAVERRAPRDPDARRGFGLLVAAATPLVAAGLAAALVGRSAGPRRAVAEPVALDATFALRALLTRGAEVQRALQADDLPLARHLLAWHLVSRDTAGLDGPGVAAAVIESVAENLGDGVVAPWIAYAALGAPGAAAYRAVNTLDAMWGYPTPPYLDLGRAAARLDDVANWLPARFTAAALVAAAAICGEDARGAWRAWRRDAASTASPNAGRPMAAMAGALGLRLEKHGAYALGEGRAPGAADIARALRLVRVAAGVAAAGVGLAIVSRDRWSGRRSAR